MKKRSVYLNEYNVLSGNSVYLPLVSGLLRAAAEAEPLLRENFRFMPYLFHRDTLGNIVSRYRDPAVAAFSVSLWNEQLSLAVAAEVKRRFPECLVVFGGPQVPRDGTDYLGAHPFVDVTVRGEGEQVFSMVLGRSLTGRDFTGVPNVAWRDPLTGAAIGNPESLPLQEDLDRYPSPYLAGVFDSLMEEHAQFEFQAIIETNRGCPFGCGYCFWGKGERFVRIRSHSLERVKDELTWCARKKIKYLFNADANYGMYDRDYQIAQHLVALKKEHGYPEKFRACYTKNAESKIFQLGKLLCENQLDKGITLSFQSLNPEALKNVNRHNINLEVYRNLIGKFNAENIPVYTELILGLPGETYASWLSGISQIVRSRLNGQLFIYLCEVYPNTELDDPAFRESTKLHTVRTSLTEIHGSVREAEGVGERIEIIVGSYSMSLADWKRMAAVSWTALLLLSMKLGNFILEYIDSRLGVDPALLIEAICQGDHGGRPVFRGIVAEMEQVTENVLSGRGKGCVVPEYGEIYWDLEEALFLKLNDRLDLFYAELEDILAELLGRLCPDADLEEAGEVVAYQKLRVPAWGKEKEQSRSFSYNLPEFFERQNAGAAVPVTRRGQLALTEPADPSDSREEFARNTVLWGRKSNSILLPVTWGELPQKP